MFVNGDFFSEVRAIEDSSVDLIITDPPYGVTNYEWDWSPLHEKIGGELAIDVMISEFLRVIRDGGTIAIFSQQPIASEYVTRMRKFFKEELIWHKNRPTGGLSVRHRHMRAHENILIFSCAGGKRCYNPQKEYGFSNYKNKGGTHAQQAGKNYIRSHVQIQDGSRFIKSVLRFDVEKYKTESEHPTRKPVVLFEHIIKTYSNENDLIFDPFAGCATTAVACEKNNRRYICFEKNEKFFLQGVNRIKNYRMTKGALFL